VPALPGAARPMSRGRPPTGIRCRTWTTGPSLPRTSRSPPQRNPPASPGPSPLAAPRRGLSPVRARAVPRRPLLSVRLLSVRLLSVRLLSVRLPSVRLPSVRLPSARPPSARPPSVRPPSARQPAARRRRSGPGRPRPPLARSPLQPGPLQSGPVRSPTTTPSPARRSRGSRMGTAGRTGGPGPRRLRAARCMAHPRRVSLPPRVGGPTIRCRAGPTLAPIQLPDGPTAPARSVTAVGPGRISRTGGNTSTLLPSTHRSPQMARRNGCPTPLSRQGTRTAAM
jgi:hypothetical protein